MKFLDILSKLSSVIGLVLLVIAVNLLSGVNKQKSSFYEYEGKKINLYLVKNIVPRVDYIITYKEDKVDDIFRKYSTILNEEEIENIENFLELAQKSDFYSVKVIAYMLFDGENIKLYNSAHFLKQPNKYVVGDRLLSRLKSYGLDEFQYESLLKLRGIVYKDKEKFLEDVLASAHLKDTEWLRESIVQLARDSKANAFMRNVSDGVEDKELSSDAIHNIVTGLKEAYRNYNGIK